MAADSNLIALLQVEVVVRPLLLADRLGVELQVLQLLLQLEP